MQRANSPSVSHSGDIDSLIGENHQHQRHIESHGRTHQSIGSVHHEHTSRIMGGVEFSLFDLKNKIKLIKDASILKLWLIPRTENYFHFMADN